MNQNNLKKIREERLLSVSEFARRTGLSPLTIYRIEKGHPCRLETKGKILRAFGYKLSEATKIFPDEK